MTSMQPVLAGSVSDWWHYSVNGPRVPPSSGSDKKGVRPLHSIMAPETDVQQYGSMTGLETDGPLETVDSCRYDCKGRILAGSPPSSHD